MEPLVTRAGVCAGRDHQAYIDHEDGWDVSKYVPYRLP
jgi:hypothetical protein